MKKFEEKTDARFHNLHFVTDWEHDEGKAKNNK